MRSLMPIGWHLSRRIHWHLLTHFDLHSLKRIHWYLLTHFHLRSSKPIGLRLSMLIRWH
ncbi:hypothetical protein [Limosilactobacillus ingluviei]|uniref:hypothetical protein n=1 Tax=Limosilactobacillus ingluviei TaxID=148604 RepID=UPI003B8A5CA9